MFWRNAAALLFNKRFNYRADVGNINFLEKSTRPGIAYAMHQCAQFSQDPRASHGYAIIYLVSYVEATRIQGIKLDP